MDWIGRSDPYLKIDLVANNDDNEVIDSVRTETKKRTLYPLWDEKFVFRVKPAEHKLVLKIFDEDRWNDDFLGRSLVTVVTRLEFNSAL